MSSDQTSQIPVVDLFAGPGGLGEGFASFKVAEERPFRIALSIEKEERAYQTLLLRSFYRQFDDAEVPSAYYQYTRGVELSESEGWKSLVAACPEQAQAARKCSLKAELGRVPVDDIREAVRGAVGANGNFILLGGPPCQAYSVIGRSRNRGNQDYVPEEDERQRLYIEYLQVLADHAPAVFIMENVRGLLSATYQNRRILERILNDLGDPASALTRESRSVLTTDSPKPEYRFYSLTDWHGDEDDPRRFVVPMEDYGIPQKRHRVLIVGIRCDLIPMMEPLQPMAEVAVRDVLSGLPSVRSGLSREQDDSQAWKSRILEAKRLAETNGAGSVLSSDLAAEIKRQLLEIDKKPLDRGGEFIEANDISVDYRRDWYLDGRVGGVCNHMTRRHRADDLHRYLFAACFANIHSRSPQLRDFPERLLPQHRNVNRGVTDGWFNDRFRVQVPERPSTTVTAHLAKDGHSFIHPDPTQCRSMTVREVARLQTFPDNYFFCGPRTSQYVQVGNAVPPLLANQIAAVVFELLKRNGLPE